MNANNRRHFTALLPCRCCGMEPGCAYCGGADDVKEFLGIKVCRRCAEAMARKFGEAES